MTTVGRSTGAQLADVLVPALAILAVGGAVTFFVWKAFTSSGEDSNDRRLSGPPPPTRFKPKPFLRSRRKDKPRFYRSAEAFTADDREGYDLDVDD